MYANNAAIVGTFLAYMAGVLLLAFVAWRRSRSVAAIVGVSRLQERREGS